MLAVAHTREQRGLVCHEFLTGTATKSEIEDKYHIGHSRITYWLKELGYDYSKPRIVPLSLMGNQSKTTSDINDEKSLSQLKKELQEAQLLAEAYRKMIEVAEHEFKIKIVKKSNTK